jgi:hypothetical protein
MQRALFKELQGFVDKPTLRAQALKRAEDGLKSSREEWTRLRGERDGLRQKPGGARLDFAFGEQWLESLKKGHAELESYIDTQKKILADENDPRRAAWRELIQQGKLEEGRFEFGKALQLYDRALNEYPTFKDQELQKHRNELAKQWQTKNAAHSKARTFIYEIWPKADPVTDKAALEEARKALEVCRENKDILTPLKLHDAAIAHAGELQKRKAGLRLDENEEDRKIAEGIAARSQDLQKLIADVQAYLQQATGAK